MTPERVPVDDAMDQLRCRVGDFETAWDAMAPAPKRVLVLRCSGLSIKEVGLRLGITPYTMKEYGKIVMQTMREATGVGEASALCWRCAAAGCRWDVCQRRRPQRCAVPSGPTVPCWHLSPGRALWHQCGMCAHRRLLGVGVHPCWWRVP